MRARKSLPVLSVAAAPVSDVGFVHQDSQQAGAGGLSRAQLISIIKAHWKSTLTIAAVLVACCAIVIKFLPKAYTATATLMVSADQRGDPLGANQALEPLGNFMATEIQLMQSSTVLLQVIDQLHLTDNKDYTDGYAGRGSMREWVNENLVKDLDIAGGNFGSQLIFVNATAQDAGLAAQIANTIADTYLTQERERVSGPANERAKRYSDELAELKAKVAAAQDQVTAFRQKNGLPDFTIQSVNIDTEMLASLEARLQEAQNARRAAEVKAMADPSLSSTGSTLNTAPVTIQPLKTQIDVEEAQLAQMQATLGARHPKVIELQNQLAANQRSLDNAVKTLHAGASADLDSARQLESKLQAAVAQQRAKVMSVSRLQDEGTKYILELESAQSVYKRALDGYDQIMFASDGRFSKVSWVSRAVPPQTSSKPKKLKLMLLAIAAGLGLGVLLPVGYELLINRRIRCGDDFERDFAVPVLMEFEPMEFEQIPSPA